MVVSTSYLEYDQSILDAYARAGALLNDLKLLPRFDDGAPFALMELDAGRTLLATRAKGSRSHHTLDIPTRLLAERHDKERLRCHPELAKDPTCMTFALRANV